MSITMLYVVFTAIIFLWGFILGIIFSDIMKGEDTCMRGGSFKDMAGGNDGEV